jgi:DNA-binding SARP family transcriptional activator/pimeloyl-ACP methyl ester carboxylesterase
MSALSIQAFGFPELHRGADVIRITLRRGLALLVYLAEAPGAVARESLATLLWPDSDAETGRARLRRLLHRLDTLAGAPLFATDRHSIALAPALAPALDTRAFEDACDRGAYAEAARIYRGDFCAGLALDDAPAFEDWLFFRREALRSRLMQTLERLVHDDNAAGRHLAAAAHAARLVELDPYSEVYGRHLIGSLLRAGDRRGAERHHAALVQRLRDELGIAPEPATDALLHEAPQPSSPAGGPTRYAEGDGVHLAYQTCGEGDIDILVMPGFVSHVERVWEQPACRGMLQAMAGLGRVIIFDRRGIGLSDRVGAAPGVEGSVADIATVLRATASRRVLLFGSSCCGPACIKFAVEQPQSVAGLVLFGSLARGCRAPDYPHALTAGQYEAWRRELVGSWGSEAGIETFGPSLAKDPQARAWWAGLLRAASSPGDISAVLAALRDTDVRALLPQVDVPTLVLHRRGDRAVRLAAGRDMADHIRGARFVELEGDDHWFFAGDQQPVLSELRDFIATLPPR